MASTHVPEIFFLKGFISGFRDRIVYLKGLIPKQVVDILSVSYDMKCPRLAKRREILIFPRTAGNTGNSRELLGNTVERGV